MINTNVEVTASITNPDKTAIRNKNAINIAVSLFDISSSFTPSTKNNIDDLKLNYTKDEISVYVDGRTKGAIYYVPIYSEKISYEAWKTKINKSFRELGTL